MIKIPKKFCVLLKIKPELQLAYKEKIFIENDENHPIQIEAIDNLEALNHKITIKIKSPKKTHLTA